MTKKAKRRAIAGLIALVLVIVACFIVGFGIGEGWEVVGKWFTSKWATLTVITVALFLVVLSYFYTTAKDKEDFK